MFPVLKTHSTPLAIAQRIPLTQAVSEKPTSGATFLISTSTPFPPMPTGLTQVYFAAAKKPPTPEYLAAQRAVAWFHQNVETIPPLDRTSRKNHRVHLKMMGEVLGFLPAASTAREACQQYTDTFNALETHVAPGKKDYRMVCDKKIPNAEANEYIVKQHGYYILVYGANGAIESFRRHTPPAVEIDGTTETDFPLRVQLFGETSADYDSVQAMLEANNHIQKGVPALLADTSRYARSIFKPGADGLDAWGQPFQFSADRILQKTAFEATEKVIPVTESILPISDTVTES